MRWSSELIAAWLVHMFTAMGSVCALLATLAVVRGRYEACFAWLFVALVIDAVDGALARAARVTEMLPRFSGERLDLVIDYVTYVFVPVLALVLGGHLVGAVGMVLAALILLSSLYHFADTGSKAEDYAFVGFPAVWNLVAFCIFAWQPAAWLTQGLIAVLVIATLVPLRWLHPMRVRRLRAANIAVMVIGMAAAGLVLWTGFPSGPVASVVLFGAAGYFAVLAGLWSWLGRHGDMD